MTSHAPLAPTQTPPHAETIFRSFCIAETSETSGPTVRMTIIGDLIIWAWSTNSTENQLIWLVGALDFHHSTRHHRRTEPWFTRRICDQQCDGTIHDARQTAHSILTHLGAI